MAEVMAVDVEMGGGSTQKKTLKRKRIDPILSLDPEAKSAKIESLRGEMKSLFDFYKELLKGKRANEGNDSGNNMELATAMLMEESGLPLSQLAAEISEKLGAPSLIGVQNRVVSIGQRVSYGVPDADANILEDDSESALWCWETKDMKLVPKDMRAVLKGRRTIRKKIQERVLAVSGVIVALEKSLRQDNCQELMKASDRLKKLLNEADIRSLVDSMGQNLGAEVAKKDAKQDEKQLIKQLEKNRREEEKEKKRLERELQREKLQNEKEQKRLQEEAEKEERRREKEESEMKKLLKKQQEELEKEQKRKEKEETVMKKQISLQKQATLMERFLKGSKTNSSPKSNQLMNKDTPVTPTQRNKELLVSVTLAMDSMLSTSDAPKEEDIWKLHVASWKCLGRSVHSNRRAYWNLRQKPKTQLVKELKLSVNRGLGRDDEMNIEKLDDGWVNSSADSRLSPANIDSTVVKAKDYVQRKKLLQFDKSHRPAFYGVMLKKSQVVSGRRPYAMDPDLEYEIDSDEEWEEEEPGESLSDCEKDNKDGEESMDEGCSKAGDDDEDDEDGFFVPDGYLSDNEGVEVDKLDDTHIVDETPGSKEAVPNETANLLFRQQKCLHSLTEQALRKNQPLIILNLMHEKAHLLSADNVSGAEKHQQMCLQALSIRAFPEGPSVHISLSNDSKDENACSSNGKASSTASATTTILESDLSYFVSIIQSSSHGLNKMADMLHEKFPAISKSQLRNKVREISDFVDNRWQVKKDVLKKLGISISPEKGSKRIKSIATFFSKRCLPPTGKSVNPNETSPQPLQKPAASTQPLQGPAKEQ